MRTFALAIAAVTLGSSALGASQATISPGNWEATSVLGDLTLPAGMPAGAEDMMRNMLGGEGMTTQSCITQEELDEAPQRIFEETDGNCQYTQFDMSGGQVEAVAQCDGPDGDMIMHMSGTYTATTYDMVMHMQGNTGMGEMTMSFDVTGRRLGDCS